MTVVAISGTPGTGKTALSNELRRRGYNVLDINEHIQANGLLGEKDEERDTFLVDVDLLDGSIRDILKDDGTIFLDSHMSHCLDSDVIFILRCSPNVLSERLRKRGYSESKVVENVQAEILDVILCEAVESDIPVYELDTSDEPISLTVDKMEFVLAGNTDKYLPGNVDWTGELDKWF
jgi:Predicted nucleotide kinase (related to CMP and AMP kinases)